jgi:hypothetical protein
MQGQHRRAVRRTTGASPISPGYALAGPTQRPASPTLRRLDVGILPQMATSPSQTINTPSPTLERIRLPFKSYPYLHSLSAPLKSIQNLRISHSTHSNPNPFGRKIEETPIYVSTKPNFIPPYVHRVLLVTLGFVGNPRRLGSPGGIVL